MADLSFLPLVGEDVMEVVSLDLDYYQPPSEIPLPLPAGNYLLRLIDGAIEKKDEDGNVLGIVPILWGYTKKDNYLAAVFSLEVVGRIVRNADKSEMVIDEFQGRRLNYQRVNRVPFSRGPRKGADMMRDMLYALGWPEPLTGVTRGERNQSYADALEKCLGKLVKGRVIRRRGVDTGEVRDGRKVYKEFRNDDFDTATGEVEFEGQTYTAYNEVAGFFRWVGLTDDLSGEVPF